MSPTSNQPRVIQKQIPLQSLSTPHESIIFNLRIDEKAEKESFTVKQLAESFFNLYIKSSEQFMFKEPIHITKEVDVNEWEKSLKYTKADIDNLLNKILIDFELEPTANNMSWLRSEIDGLISLYGKGLDSNLPDEARTMLNNLITRMAYDTLCVPYQ
jgi:hypothetical protein